MNTLHKKTDSEILFLIPPKDVTSVVSHVDRVYGCNYGFDYKPPIHLLLLATIAQESGCRVRLLDCPAEGIDKKQLILYLKRCKPLDAVVFFSVWLSYAQDREAARLVSSIHKKVKKVFTGPFPTWKPELFIEADSDFVIRGEPEEALIELLDTLDQKERLLVKNSSFLVNGSLQHTASGALIDIDRLPIPDRTLLKGRYSFTRLASWPATVMCTSRGCSYHCTYCAPHALDQAIETEQMKKESGKPPLRIRKAGMVIDEFKEVARLGYKGVEICDNQFVWDVARINEICAAISTLGLEWICCARADYLLDKQMLESMRQAGCRQIYIGTESFCQEILDDIRKELQLEDVYKAVSMVRAAGIEPEISVLLGASGKETESTIATSYRQAKKCKTRFVHYSVALPLPHTQLYKTAKAHKWLRTSDFVPMDNIRGALLDLPHITAKRLQFLVSSFYARQYLAPRFLISQLLNKGFYRNFCFRAASFFKLLVYLFKEKCRA
jgi:anaerobic magnesium-protoporphyrin IX monomethyl ester cyclase